MHWLRLVSAVVVIGAVSTARAHAAGPVAVSGWDNTSDEAAAVADDGRGVLVFPHGEHAWAASIAPDGSISGLGRIEAPRAVDGPNQLVAAMDDAGAAVAGYVAFNGQQPQVGSGGFGFVQRPWISRFVWGQPPAPATLLARGLINTSGLVAAMRDDGTASLAWSQMDVPRDRDSSWEALVAPNGTVARHGFGVLRGARPASMAVTGDGRFVTGWADDQRLGVTHVTPPGRFRADRVRARDTSHVLVDGAGDQVVVWERRGRQAVLDVRLASRHGAGRLGREQVVARHATLVDAFAGPSGELAILVGQGRRRLELVRRGADGRLLAPVDLPGPALSFAPVGSQHAVGVTADGTVIVLYDLVTSPTATAARAVRVAPDGTTSVLGDAPGCSPLALAVAPSSGAGVVALRCDNADGTSAGAVETLPAAGA